MASEKIIINQKMLVSRINEATRTCAARSIAQTPCCCCPLVLTTVVSSDVSDITF